MKPISRELQRAVSEIARTQTELRPDRMLARRPSRVEPDCDVVIIAEFHGAQVTHIREVDARVVGALAERGVCAHIEWVRADWLPRAGRNRVDAAAAARKWRALLRAREATGIEDGSFAALSEKQKDAFRYFGSWAKIRTPVELTYPRNITIGNWVSLGRYGKLVLLPDEAFARMPQYLRQHYPEIAPTVDPAIYVEPRNPDLYIGDGTSLGDRYFIICTKSVHIGRHVMTASNLFISDCHHVFEGTEAPPILVPPTSGKPVRIEDHVWIGINCCILEGVTIGKHAVVAANSVVREDVPPYSLVAGCPARVKKVFGSPGLTGGDRYAAPHH